VLYLLFPQKNKIESKENLLFQNRKRWLTEYSYIKSSWIVFDESTHSELNYRYYCTKKNNQYIKMIALKMQILKEFAE
jgi:hypothetical protein